MVKITPNLFCLLLRSHLIMMVFRTAGIVMCGMKKTLTLYVNHTIKDDLLAGIVDDYLTGPYLLYDHLNGYRYLRFLLRVLPELLEDIPLAVRE